MNGIDTNVVVYLHDATAPETQTRAQQLLDDLVLNPHETVWMWQVAVGLGGVLNPFSLIYSYLLTQ